MTDSASSEAIEFASVSIRKSSGEVIAGGMTGADGTCILKAGPGKWTAEVSSVGYRPAALELNISRDAFITVALSRDDALREVIVTARESRNATSSSVIDTTAMRHLQPSSFTDLLALLPGGITKDPETGAVNSIALRQAEGITPADDYATSSLGTSFVVDGVRLNTDADMQGTPDGTRSGRIATGKGVDMRSLSTDEIESVEIVRGIPSVEYGELTSGLVKIRRKSGAGRLEARFKADTQSQLFYAGKGFDVCGDERWIINAGIGWLDSRTDPRNNRDSYRRMTGSLRSLRRWSGPAARLTWNSSFSYSGTFEKDDNDPDLTVNNTVDFYSNNRHSFSWDNSFVYAPGTGTVLEELSLIIGVSYASENLEQHRHVASSRIMPMPVSLVGGSNYVGYLPMFYLADYRVEGRPFTAQAKASGRLMSGGRTVTEGLKFGVEWSMSKNYGRGAVYDLSRPLSAGNNSRPRAFRDIPAMHQLSAYVESRTGFRAGRSSLTLTAGLRETQLLHLDSRYVLSGKPYFDPRFNLVWSLPRATVAGESLNVELSAGLGRHTKMPVAAFLYPEKYYTDIEQLNYYHNIPAYRTMNVMTYVEDMTNYRLRPARNFKREIRADISYRGNRLSVTFFSEEMTDGFRTSPEVFIYGFRRYDASGYDPALTGHAPAIEELPSAPGAFLALLGRPSNGSRTDKKGVEYTFSTRRFNAIHTRLTVSGAYFRTTNSNSQALWYRPSVVVEGKELQYAGLYDDNDGSVYTSMNTNFLFDTDIQRLGLNFSIGVQNVWFTSRRTLWRDGRPVSYMDIEGKIHPYTDVSAADASLKQLIRPFSDSSFKRLTVPVATTVNIKATKTFWKRRVGMAIYVNRLVAVEPDYRRYGITIRRYSTPYFGMELNLKF